MLYSPMNFGGAAPGSCRCNLAGGSLGQGEGEGEGGGLLHPLNPLQDLLH